MYVSDELVDLLAAGELPYLDLPLQHASDPILRGMNRRVTRRETDQLLDRLRADRATRAAAPR